MYHKDIAETAAAELARLKKRQAELALELAEAEKAEAIEFEKARPAAEALLARLQLRAEVAKEILAERQAERQKAFVDKVMSRHSGQDQERDRDDDRGQDR